MGNDDCRSIIEENLRLHEDFLTISRMIRERELNSLRMQSEMAVSESIFEEDLEPIIITDTIVIKETSDEIVDKILEISDKNIIKD